jgi:para-aminobenzoate synthetase component 1
MTLDSCGKGRAFPADPRQNLRPSMSLSVPLKIELIRETPIEVFSRLEKRPYAFWLDSAAGPLDTTRWSFLGAEPLAVMETWGGESSFISSDSIFTRERDPLDALASFLNHYAIPPQPELPPFIGGAVGWLSYDLARQWEKLPSIALNDTRLPDMKWAFYPTLYAYDHRNRRMWRISREDLKDMIHHGGHGARGDTPLEWPEKQTKRKRSLCSFVEKIKENSLTKDAYFEALSKVKEYIAAGDIYQANLTQRFVRPYCDDPAELYLRLREVNPAPFAAYLGFEDVHVMSASPERFLSYDATHRRVETRPIKGTRPRSPDPMEDRRRADELLHSEKDRAENLMIVDVHRNDLGRVCEIGSVTVPSLWGLESYATVHHLVSVVQGRLASDRTPFDLLRAAFPAGSITGAPKLRAMEIIEALEPVRRGIYTGSIGYIGWDGSMDLSVAIRTLVAQNGWVHYGVGGGIVADSDAEPEYQETLDKAKGLELALRKEPIPSE